METVAAHPAGFVLAGQGEAGDHGGVAGVKGRVEAGGLDQLRPQPADGRDRRQALRLVQRRQRTQGPERADRLGIETRRPGEARAMNDAMADRRKALRLGPRLDPGEEVFEKARRGALRFGPGGVGQRATCAVASPDARRRAGGLDLPAQQGANADVLRGEQGELAAGGADNERPRRAGHAREPGFSGGTPCSAIRTARAQEATCVSTESARLVRALGTRAPSTTAAAAAPPRNTSNLTSMIQATKTGF